jgi:hypothetical protein
LAAMREVRREEDWDCECDCDCDCDCEGLRFRLGWRRAEADEGGMLVVRGGILRRGFRGQWRRGGLGIGRCDCSLMDGELNLRLEIIDFLTRARCDLLVEVNKLSYARSG